MNNEWAECRKLIIGLTVNSSVEEIKEVLRAVTKLSHWFDRQRAISHAADRIGVEQHYLGSLCGEVQKNG